MGKKGSGGKLTEGEDYGREESEGRDWREASVGGREGWN